MAMFTGRRAAGVFQASEGVSWRWSSGHALHSGRAMGAAAALGGGVEGVDAGVSLVQGASRGLGLEFVS